jgi:hypothetical protein
VQGVDIRMDVGEDCYSHVGINPACAQ